MQRLVRIMVVLALAAGVVPFGALPASAEAPAEYGYWYRLNSRQLVAPQVPGAPPVPQPSPPGVTEGQVYLGQDPTEPLAVAAFVFFADDGPGATFELEIARGALPPEADLVACPTTSSFASEFAGFWENRPLGECETLELPGETLGTNESFLWTLTAEFQVFPGYWSFVVEPRGTTPFEMVFEEPETGSFSVDAGPGQFEDAGPPPPPGDFTDAPTDDPFAFDGGGGAGPPMFTDFGDDFGADVDAPADVPAGDTPDEPMERAAAPPIRDDTTARILAIILLAAMGVGMFFLTRLQGRPAAALVGGRAAAEGEVEVLEDAEAEPGPAGPVGGIGRFQRARATGPRRLV